MATNVKKEEKTPLLEGLLPCYVLYLYWYLYLYRRLYLYYRQGSVIGNLNVDSIDQIFF